MLGFKLHHRALYANFSKTKSSLLGTGYRFVVFVNTKTNVILIFTSQQLWWKVSFFMIWCFHSVTFLFYLFVFLFMTSFLNKILKRKMLSDFSTWRKFQLGMFASSVACSNRTITLEFVERKSVVVHLIRLRVIACDAVHTTIFF